MMPISFTTPCGHEATVKPCQSRNGKNAGKWSCRIRGSKVTLKSGVKTMYCSPTKEAAKAAIASFLGITPSSVTEKGAAIIKTESAVPSTTAVAAVATAPGVASIPPQQPPFIPMSASQGPYGATAVGYPGLLGGSFPPSQPFVPSQPYGYPPHMQNLHPYAGPGGYPVYPSAPLPRGPSALPSALQSTSMKSASTATHVPSLANPAIAKTAGADAIKRGSGSKAIIPTAEQERIYQHAKPPTPIDKNFIMRITAGAGAGKTTTVLELAAKAARLGHNHITYLTFSRAAAMDGARRITETLTGLSTPPIIEARTLHACAMKLLSDARNEAFEEEDKRLLDDARLQKFIKQTCEKEVQEYLTPANQEIAKRNRNDPRKGASMMEAAERQVLFYIFKTLVQFCRSQHTLEQFKDPTFRNRNYFPTEKFHRENGDGEKQGFPHTAYRFKLSSYADMACLVWDVATEKGVRTYDMEMKRAQLRALRIPGSLLLVDESQDMDGCQVDWIAKQIHHGTHVYLVGDAAQTIYSFRGAKSRYMMNVEGAVDCTLTKSWRFGTNIANIANVILFSKEKSPQTTGNDYSPIWRPYRLEGCGGEGTVTADPILPKWKDMPVTLIAATNATLLHMAVSMLGMTTHNDVKEQAVANDDEVVKEEITQSEDPLPQGDEPTADSQEPHIITQSDDSQDTAPKNAMGSSPYLSQDLAPSVPNATGSSDGIPDASNSAEATSDDSLPICLPKIHINGKGENSGMKKWKSVMKQIQHIFDLYKSGDDGAVLPRETFHEFRGEKLTWRSFQAQVEHGELTRYASSIHVVSRFGDKTMEAMELFEREVMDNNYKAEEADVILTTCHAAKGMEWDNVQVCEDFNDLCKVKDDGPLTPNRGGSSNCKRSCWQFDMKNYGDDVNVLYVACTRAKKILSISSSIKRLLEDCDMLHTMIRHKNLYNEFDGTKSSEITVFGRNEPLSVQSALHLYRDLVVPLRKQYNLQTKERLIKVLVKSLDGEDDYDDDDKSLQGDEQFEKYFAVPQQSKASTAVNNEYAAITNGVITEANGSAAKKPRKAKAFYVLEDSKNSAALAPKGTKRPYDKKENSPNGKATCRDCGQLIAQGASRVGIQVYQQGKGEWWALYFHEKCCPKDVVQQLKLDPKPPKKSAAKKSSRGGRKSWGGYKKGGYYSRGYKNSWSKGHGRYW